MRRVLLGIFILCLLASPALAEKKRKTALLLSGVGTGVSSGLVLSSFLIKSDHTVYDPTFYAGLATSIVTPSLGEWYAGKWFTVGMGIRAGGALMAVYGISQTQDQHCFVDPTQNCPTLTGTGFTVLSIAAIVYIGGVVYDVLDAEDAVEGYNRHHVMLTPTATHGGGGMALVGTF
jgi:hypothetical protein